MSTSPPKLADLLSSWLLALRVKGRSAKTLKTYAEGVKSFLSWCDQTGTPPTPAALTRENFLAFIADLLDRGVAGNTARARHAAVKRFSAWLASEGEIAVDELAGLGQPSVDTQAVDPLSVDELQAILKACHGKTFMDRRDEAIVRVMVETGMRAGECSSLALADVDLVRGVAHIRRGKGGKGRIVPFGATTAAALDRYIRARRSHKLAGTSALWLGDRSKTFGYTALYRALKVRAESAGVRFYPHLLRHTAATRWLRAGGSEGGLMAVAGWRNRAMLDRYVAATASERAAAEARGLNLGDL